MSLSGSFPRQRAQPEPFVAHSECPSVCWMINTNDISVSMTGYPFKANCTIVTSKGTEVMWNKNSAMRGGLASVNPLTWISMGSF